MKYLENGHAIVARSNFSSSTDHAKASVVDSATSCLLNATAWFHTNVAGIYINSA